MHLYKNAKKTFSHRKLKRKEKLFIFRMLLIPILNLIVFFYYLNFNSVLMAFKIGNEPGFTLHHFQVFINEMMSADSTIIKAMINTLLFFVMNIAIIFPCSLLLSYFLYRKIPGYNAFRVIFFIPSIISGVALVSVFKNFIDPTGPLAVIFKNAFHRELPELLADSRYAKWTIMAFCLWTGFASNMILFGGAMTRVPLELIESGKIDGTGVFIEFSHIVLPLIWPTISTLLTFVVVGIFSASGPILLFTQGRYDTFTISYWIFDQVKNISSFNYPSAVGLFFTAIAFPIVMLVKRLLDKIGSSIEY